MNDITVRVSEGGRLVIPVEYRKELGIHEGDKVLVRIQDGELRILPVQGALRRAQRVTRQYVSPERSLSEELIAERRQDAEDE